jgi:hypothetical protein
MARPGEEGKLDASGTSHSGNANVAEICNQVLMMLSHEIFDPEFGKRVLIDQAFIVAGGEITKLCACWQRVSGRAGWPGPVRESRHHGRKGKKGKCDRYFLGGQWLAGEPSGAGPGLIARAPVFLPE